MNPIQYNFSFKIKSSGIALPQRSFSNLEILKRIPEFSEKSNVYFQAADRRIKESYGYENRYLSYAPFYEYDDKSTSESLAKEAMHNAIKVIQENPELLIHGTTTSSRYTSTQAAALVREIDSFIPAFEVKAGCATGLLAFQNAFNWMRQGYKNCLVVVAETLSRVQSKKNPSSWLGLADAAAAIFFEASPVEDSDFTCEKILYYTDGSAADFMTSRVDLPLKPDTLTDDEFAISGDEQAFHEKAQFHYRNMVRTLLPSEEEKDSIKWILSHQVNRSLIQQCLIDEFFPNAQSLWVNQETGNIGSVSIPFLLHKYCEANLFKKGDRLLLITVGGGMNCQAQVWLRN